MVRSVQAMRGLRIYLADGTYNGTVTMSSDSSKISAIRVTRENISNYENELDGAGLYMLLVGSNAVYVGQTGLDTIQKKDPEYSFRGYRFAVAHRAGV